MNKKVLAAVIGVLVVLVLLAIGATLLMPFWGRVFGFGLMRPGIFRFGVPFILGRGLGMLLLAVLLIGGVIWFVRSGGQPQVSNSAAAPALETPLDILKRRYANGELTKEQFEEMKNTLGA